VGLEYVRHYGEGAHALVRLGTVWCEYGDSASRSIFEALLTGVPQGPRLLGRLLGLGPSMRARRAEPRLLLNPMHGGMANAAYARTLRQQGRRAVHFLHDLIPIAHPEFSRPGEDRRHDRRMDTILGSSTAVVVNSRDTRGELMAFARARGVVAPPTLVAPLGCTRLPATGTRLVEGRYFVMIGTIEPRKNHAMMLYLWRRLAREFPDATPKLVIIGRRGWECEHVVDLLERCPDVRAHVIERSQCDDAELSSWLHHAAALLFPSFAEGYGLPLVEALAAGVPVLASRLPVFQEIAGDIPEYLDPLDGPAWLEAIRDYARADSARAARQRAEVVGYQPPSWADHFAAVDAFLEPHLASAAIARDRAEPLHAAVR
jgi:glycosyltransferase involved in cell wall biosynthesis